MFVEEPFHSGASARFRSSDFFFSAFFSVLQDTRIRVVEKEWSGQRSRRLSVANPSAEGSQSLVFSAESSEELEDWLDALHQHLFDQSECGPAKDADVLKCTCARSRKRGGGCFGKAEWEAEWTDSSPLIPVSLTSPRWKPGQWLHCCNQLMKIEVVSPRKPSLFLTKQADSVYNDLSE